MARSRNIKPGLFVNDTLAELPIAARYLFSGLWVIADRDGRLEDRPRKIKAQILPYDDEDIEALLQGLHDKGFILRYDVESNRYISIINWHKHQNPHVNEAPSSIPPPTEYHTSTVQVPESSTTNPADSLILDPDSLNLDPGFSSAASAALSLELALTEKPKRERPRKLPNEDYFEYALFIAQAAGYSGYPNKAEACKQAKSAKSMGITAEELAGCVTYMLETNGTFWASQTLTIASAMRQWPAYQKALKNGWKPGQKGQSNGTTGRSDPRALGNSPNRANAYAGPSGNVTRETSSFAEERADAERQQLLSVAKS